MRSRNCPKLLLTSLLATSVFSQDQGYVSAKKLFYAEPETSVKPTIKTPKKSATGIRTVPISYPVAGLRYTVLQEVQPGREVAVDPDKEFHSGDRVRFEFESNLDGYLYVTQEGSSGLWTVLFPDARINGGKNQVQKRQPYQVPARTKYFVFNDVPGNEKLIVFLAKSPLNDLPRDANSTPQTVDHGVIDELNNRVPVSRLGFRKG